MRCSILTFILVAVTVPSLALPLQGELVTREPEPGKPSWYLPPSKGGNGGNAQTGNTGNVNGGNVINEGFKISNGWGASTSLYFTAHDL